MPKENKTVQKIKSGSTIIEVKHYADGRYGYDYRLPGEIRKKVRFWSLEKAVNKAKRDAEKLSRGRAELLSMNDDRLARLIKLDKQRQAGSEIPTLVDSFLKSKEGKGRSEYTLRDLKGVLEKFKEDFLGPIADLTRADVENWLNAREVGPRRWNNMLSSIVALVRFARREGFLTADITPVEQIEKRDAHSVIETYTPRELQQLIAAVEDEWLPVIILGAFAGMRPEEICQEPSSTKPAIQWQNILWEKKKIDVPKEVSKVGRRRFIPLTDAAVAFLSPLKKVEGPVVPSKRLSNQIRRWAAKAKVTWKNDGLRHSYASYRLAIIKDIGELALEMGNSPKIIHDHYLDLKHEDEATQWFALRPLKRLKPENVIVLTA